MHSRRRAHWRPLVGSMTEADAGSGRQLRMIYIVRYRRCSRRKLQRAAKIDDGAIERQSASCKNFAPFGQFEHLLIEAVRQLLDVGRFKRVHHARFTHRNKAPICGQHCPYAFQQPVRRWNVMHSSAHADDVKTFCSEGGVHGIKGCKSGASFLHCRMADMHNGRELLHNQRDVRYNNCRVITARAKSNRVNARTDFENTWPGNSLGPELADRFRKKVFCSGYVFLEVERAEVAPA